MADLIETSKFTEPERAILVGLDLGDKTWPIDTSLDELERLADTAGAVTVCKMTQRLDHPNPKTFIGSGKAREVAKACHVFDAQVVILDDEITPSQQRNLESIVPRDVKVIDRTALILDIFGLHATTREGRLQVRLAQNQYLLPRLRGMWKHLAAGRMGGGVGSRFGEGESQLEVDRRMVRKRITSITRELKVLEGSRDLQRKSRIGSGLFRVALAGYTNAGKSSLLNCLTGADVMAYDKFFATLDPTTRRLVLPEGRQVTITDTVGFIQKLPTTLVEAFKSTLAEASQADLILVVVDASDPNHESQTKTVGEVLEQIGAGGNPQLIAFNKVDLLGAEEMGALRGRYPGAVFVSARTGKGIDGLVGAISTSAAAASATLNLIIPYAEGSFVQFAHEKGQVLSESFEEDGTHMLLRIPPRLVSRFSRFARDTAGL